MKTLLIALLLTGCGSEIKDLETQDTAQPTATATPTAVAPGTTVTQNGNNNTVIVENNTVNVTPDYSMLPNCKNGDNGEIEVFLLIKQDSDNNKWFVYSSGSLDDMRGLKYSSSDNSKVMAQYQNNCILEAQ